MSERHGACSSRSVATCRWRYLHVPPEAGPPLAVVGEGGRDARAAQCVLVSLRSRRAGGGTRVCRPARVLCRPWLERSVASRERHGACLSRCDRDAPVAAHTHVTPGAGTPPAMAGEVRRVGGGAHTCAAQRRPSAGRGGGEGGGGRLVASRERHGACSSRCDRGAPALAHTCAIPGGPSACRGWGGRSRRASGTERARLAAIATRRRRHTHVLPGAGPPPAVAGEGGCVARAARCVLVSLRSRRVGGGTPMCRPRQALHRPWLGRAVVSRERHADVHLRPC